MTIVADIIVQHWSLLAGVALISSQWGYTLMKIRSIDERLRLIEKRGR